MAEHELNKIVDADGEVFNLRDSTKQPVADRVTAWGSTPSDTKYPSEKLVKDGLDAKADAKNFVVTNGAKGFMLTCPKGLNLFDGVFVNILNGYGGRSYRNITFAIRKEGLNTPTVHRYNTEVSASDHPNGEIYSVYYGLDPSNENNAILLIVPYISISGLAHLSVGDVRASWTVLYNNPSTTGLTQITPTEHTNVFGASKGSTSVPVYVNASGAATPCTDDFVHDGDVTSTYSATGTDPVNGTAVASAISGKADKVSNATSGNFASLDANGNLTDSGHNHKDYALLNRTYGTRGYITGAGSNPDLLLEKLKLGVIQLYQGTGVGIKLYEYDTGDEANAVLVWDSSTLTGDALQKFLNGQNLGTIYTSTAGKCIKAEYNGHTAGAYYYCRAFGIFMTPKQADTSHTATAVCRINGVTYASYTIDTYGGLVTAVCPDGNYTTVIVNFTPSATTTRMRFYGFRCLNTYDGEDAVLLGRATSALSATKATQDSDGNAINSTYLKLSGGTMTGKITAWGSKYTDDGTTGAIDMQNSNIVGLNSIYTKDASENASEGIHFYRDATHTDTLWMAGGHMYFVPNRTLAGSSASTSAADSHKVAILPASITSGHVVVTDGTSGDVKGVAASTLTVGVASKLGTANKGSTTKPIYLAAGVPTECTTYAGGTAVTLNNASKAGSTASFYAPTAGGTANYVLIGNGTTSAPTWAEKAPKASAADTAAKIATSAKIGDTNKPVYVAADGTITAISYTIATSVPSGAVFTDTKQNITLATTTKAFITGVSTTPTGTAQALTGLADTGVYLTKTAGELNATQYKVNEHCTMKYNSTKSSLDFTFS